MSNPPVSSTESKKTVTLKTADGKLFEVDSAVAMESVTVKNFLDDDASSYSIIPLPNVTSPTLSKIILFLSTHLQFKSKQKPEPEAGEDGDSSSDEAQKAFEAEFLKDLDHVAIIDMIHAANYLNIKDLLELLNQTTADLIKNMTVEQVREFFGIENDYSVAEETQLREENRWAFE